jgi:hypothetical protein
MPNSNRRPDPGDSQPPTDAEPAALNRAERRAHRRGRKPALPPTVGKGVPGGHHDQVVVPRRAGRRGNR